MTHQHQNIYKWKLLLPFEITQIKDEGDNTTTIIIPMAAPVNTRDITLTRIRDSTREELIQFSDAHMLFGSSSTSSENNMHAIVPALCRTCIGFTPPIPSSFSSVIAFDEAKRKNYALLSSLHTTNCLQVPLEEDLVALNAVDPSIGTTELLCYLLQTLDMSYEQFNKIECYNMLGAAIRDAALKLSMDAKAFLHTDHGICSEEVCTMYNFQKFISPCLMSIMNSSHRHMRLLCDMLWLDMDAASHLLDAGVPGFELRVENIDAFQSSCNPLISYNFYDLADSSKTSHDYSSLELQSVSRNESERIHLSRVAESCHQIQALIQAVQNQLVLNDTTGHFSLVGGKLKEYLSIPKYSTVKNSNRGDAEDCYIAFRKIKQNIRETICGAFYPSCEIECIYKKGVTFAEKFEISGKNAVFARNSAPDINPLLYTFLLLDNFTSRSDMNSLASMVQKSYMGRHREQSVWHNLEHAKLWNSHTIWSDMNKFVVFLIRLMKEAQAESVSSLMCFKPADSRLLRQKISHTCQHYAFYVALTLVNDIGLFPHIPNIKWRYTLTAMIVLIIMNIMFFLS